METENLEYRGYTIVCGTIQKDNGKRIFAQVNSGKFHEDIKGASEYRSFFEDEKATMESLIKSVKTNIDEHIKTIFGA